MRKWGWAVILLAVFFAGCGRGAGGEPTSDQVIAKVREATDLFNAYFALGSLATNGVCMTLPEFHYYCEVDDKAEGIRTYEDLQARMGKIYTGEAAEIILSGFVRPFSERGPYMIRNRVMYTVSTSRKPTPGYENLWDRATAERIGSRDGGKLLEFRFVLPNRRTGGEDAGEGSIEKKVELVRTDDGWKLNTPIDTLGL